MKCEVNPIILKIALQYTSTLIIYLLTKSEKRVDEKSRYVSFFKESSSR